MRLSRRPEIGLRTDHRPRPDWTYDVEEDLCSTGSLPCRAAIRSALDAVAAVGAGTPPPPAAVYADRQDRLVRYRAGRGLTD
jgi:hypothetical protein